MGRFVLAQTRETLKTEAQLTEAFLRFFKGLRQKKFSILMDLKGNNFFKNY